MTTKRMSTTTWTWWKTNQHDVVDKMPKLQIDIGGSAFFTKAAALQAKRGSVSDENLRFGKHLGGIFDWLDDNCDQPYYAKFTSSEKFKYENGRKADVTFFFMDQGDAISFRMMFQIPE